MTILIEQYRGHLIYMHTGTVIYTCNAVGSRNSFFQMCRAIDEIELK